MSHPSSPIRVQGNRRAYIGLVNLDADHTEGLGDTLERSRDGENPLGRSLNGLRDGDLGGSLIPDGAHSGAPTANHGPDHLGADNGPEKESGGG